MSIITDYAPIVGESTLEELSLLADRLKGRAIQNINSTAVGGGVAEILLRMLPLLQAMGVNARWDVIRGDERFFVVTKKMHNALHGVAADFAPGDLDHFLEVNRQNARDILSGADVVFIHDPQPIALV
ncbi:MAG: glycosyl transferase family 1, partial [Candidatus Aminicenantes bacterium]|nr:glycosyl transferase family 1 [Candidatus Aminicenantes bacterium]